MRKLVSISVAVLAFCAVSQAATWNVPGSFTTIANALSSTSVADGDTILVGAGSHAGAFVTKRVEIIGEDGAVINSGPPHSSGLTQGFRLLAGSDGATISHLIFTVDLAIMNGGAVNNVTVENCTFLNTIQAVSNWGGCGWLISHNVITDLRTSCGGGIGILVGARFGEIVENNVVSHNKISGTLHVSGLEDEGGYDGSGIVLYADFRWGWPGAKKITANNISKNKIGLVSDKPDVVNVWAFEMTDTRVAPDLTIIVGNSVGFNDFRDTANQITLTPDTLVTVNNISRNLGENRGHGLHPSVFSAN